ncbi:MAG: hypothetical protein R6U20_12800 [Longimonas sp.]
MAKKGKGAAAKKMARIVFAEKKDNGNYSFRQKMVPLDSVKEKLKQARAN